MCVSGINDANRIDCNSLLVSSMHVVSSNFFDIKTLYDKFLYLLYIIEKMHKKCTPYFHSWHQMKTGTPYEEWDPLSMVS